MLGRIDRAHGLPAGVPDDEDARARGVERLLRTLADELAEAGPVAADCAPRHGVALARAAPDGRATGNPR